MYKKLMGYFVKRLRSWVWPLTIVVCLAASVFSSVLATKIIEKTQSPGAISIDYPYGILELPEIKPAVVPKKAAKLVPAKKKPVKPKKPVKGGSQADKTE
jgi:peptidoglycan/LPS O-acetylase OafA/YrhL